MFIIEVCTDGDALLHFDKIAELCHPMGSIGTTPFQLDFFPEDKKHVSISIDGLPGVPSSPVHIATPFITLTSISYHDKPMIHQKNPSYHDKPLIL